MFFSTLILLAIVILLILKYYVYAYWERKGFPYIKPIIPFGNCALYVFRKMSMGENILVLYEKSKKPIEGIFILFRPALLVRDVNLIHRMLLSDFKHFHDRGIYVDPRNDSFSDTIFSMEGQKWKYLRTKLSPAFSSGKIKQMFPIIQDMSQNLVNSLRKTITQQQNLINSQNNNNNNNNINNDINNGFSDFKGVTVRYSIDVIGTVALGLNVNSIDNPLDDILLMASTITSSNLMNAIRTFGAMLCPEMMEFFKIKTLSSDVEMIMIEIVKKTREYRKRNNNANSNRNDLMEYLLQLRDDGDTKSGRNEGNKNATEIMDSYSDELCAAQVALFFAAGVDTTASAIAFTLFELSRNAVIRERLLADINETLNRHNGQITYESINEMNYLELCVMEIVRKYPGLPFLNRICTENFQFDNLTIEKGMPIIIPLLGISRDNQYFERAIEFLPERFLPENKHMIKNSNAYIPFGEGPRACIGIRIGKLITKIGLVALLQNFQFECKSNGEIEFDNFGIGLFAKNGVQLKCKMI